MESVKRIEKEVRGWRMVLRSWTLLTPQTIILIIPRIYKYGIEQLFEYFLNIPQGPAQQVPDS